jgi:hypothetical protein
MSYCAIMAHYFKFITITFDWWRQMGHDREQKNRTE